MSDMVTPASVTVCSTTALVSVGGTVLPVMVAAVPCSMAGTVVVYPECTVWCIPWWVPWWVHSPVHSPVLLHLAQKRAQFSLTILDINDTFSQEVVLPGPALNNVD